MKRKIEGEKMNKMKTIKSKGIRQAFRLTCAALMLALLCGTAFAGRAITYAPVTSADNATNATVSGISPDCSWHKVVIEVSGIWNATGSEATYTAPSAGTIQVYEGWGSRHFPANATFNAADPGALLLHGVFQRLLFYPAAEIVGNRTYTVHVYSWEE